MYRARGERERGGFGNFYSSLEGSSHRTHPVSVLLCWLACLVHLHKNMMTSNFILCGCTSAFCSLSLLLSAVTVSSPNSILKPPLLFIHASSSVIAELGSDALAQDQAVLHSLSPWNYYCFPGCMRGVCDDSKPFVEVKIHEENDNLWFAKLRTSS